MKGKLSQDIQREYSRLVRVVSSIPVSARLSKEIDGTGGKVSVVDLIAYQIGWGKCLIRWYEAGIEGKESVMPGDGFSTWNYTQIAKHFYEKYRYDSASEQEREFDSVVSQILNIVEKESQSGNLDQLGVWSWCTLQSGKQWPLSKWIRVNTVAPYKRASAGIEQRR